MFSSRKLLIVNRERWLNEIVDIYRRMQVRANYGTYLVPFGDISLIVLPNVYAPGFFTDSSWFADNLSDIVGEKSLLEIGTGTGVIAITCARCGAHVVATDLNPAAVQNARINVAQLGLPILVREGYLFGPIEPGERFDFIFWAHPFNNWETPVEDILLRSGMDYHYEGLKGYITGGKNHLARRGRLLLGTGDSADLETISLAASENGYEIKILREARMALEERGRLMITYFLIEFVAT